ncbi:diguanylate cyclase domain-containing protein [Acidicapsa acidisoli]|uniref:diguanylate cyclase domain-containing protein n=1 Tax=Acidicapsa acidisoli TaxID=1615681 RepID=UPI0021E07A9E|nr:diguanylate cyclase [Acidicapsa acidisoli]
MPNSADLLRVTLQSIRDAVVATDQDARIQLLNPAAEVMTGWISSEAVGKAIDEIVDLQTTGSGPALPNPAHQVLRENARVDISQPVMLIGKGGQRTAVQITASPLQDSAGMIEGCVIALHDVSEALQLAERISYLSNQDVLTGLPNRILFMDRLEQGTRVSDRNSDQLAIMFVDLDHFTEIRAACGNPVADELIKEAAARMNACLRESDSVCRLGGDEFVILITGVKSLADVDAVAEKLLTEIAAPFAIREHTLQTTCSLGISTYPRDASDAETLMRLADGAMHQAKRNGRNRYLFANPEAQREPTQIFE